MFKIGYSFFGFPFPVRFDISHSSKHRMLSFTSYFLLILALDPSFPLFVRSLPQHILAALEWLHPYECIRSGRQMLPSFFTRSLLAYVPLPVRCSTRTLNLSVFPQASVRNITLFHYGVGRQLINNAEGRGVVGGEGALPGMSMREGRNGRKKGPRTPDVATC